MSLLQTFPRRILTIAGVAMVTLLGPAGFTRLTGAGGVTITEPRGGFTTKQTQRVAGTIAGNVERATVVVNGIPQDVPVRNGRYAVNVVVAPGTNIVEVRSPAGRDSTSFYARVPRRDIKIVLTWDDARYVDLWVTDPKGERCYWASPVTSSGGNLIANDETGFGPQIFTMEKAIPGQYSVDVQYYSKGFAPVSRVKVYGVLYEGTPREKRMRWDFVMTKAMSVFHIAEFEIENVQ